MNNIKNINMVFLAYYFPPQGGGGIQRTVKFIKYLPEYNVNLIVLASPTNMTDYWSPLIGDFFEQLPSDLIVERVKGSPRQSPRIFEKAKNWLYMKSDFSKWWVKECLNEFEKIVLKNSVDVLLVTMQPYESALVGEIVSHKYRIPWVADLRDPWALDEMEVYPTAIHRELEKRKMKRILNTASAIIMNTPEARKRLLEKINLKNDIPVHVITNGYDKEDFKNTTPNSDENKFRIVHSGSLHTEGGLKYKRNQIRHKLLGSRMHDVNVLTRSHYYLLEAINGFIKSFPESKDNMEIIFAGNATDDDREIAGKYDFKNIITFTGYISHDKNLDLIKSASVLFLPMHKLKKGERATIIPGKMYEYIATGNPIIAAVPEGDAKDILKNLEQAHICDGDDINGILKGLKKFYIKSKDKSAKNYSNPEMVKEFERSRLTKKLVEILEDVSRKQ